MILQVVKIQESWWLLLREKQPPLSSISVSRSIWQMKTLRVWQGQKRQEATVRCSSQGLVGPKSSFPKKNCTEHNVLHSSSKYIFDMSFWKYSSLSHRSCLVAGCTASMVLFTKKKKRKDLSNCDTSLTWMTQRSRLDTSFQWCNGVTSGLDQLSSPETIWSGTWLWAQTSKKDQVNQVKIFFSVALELGLVTLGPSVNDITQLQSRFFVGTFATVQLPRPGRGTVSTVRRAKGRWNGGVFLCLVNS